MLLDCRAYMYNNFEGDIIQLAENSGAHLVVYETILVYTDTELLVLFHWQSAVPIAIHAKCSCTCRTQCRIAVSNYVR